MNAKLTTRITYRLWLTALLLPLSALIHAQDPEPTATPTDPLAGIPIQVLDQQQVEIGTHKITYNRIAPPVFPLLAPPPTPSDTATDNAASQEPRTRAAAPSRRTKDDSASGAEKPYKMLSLSATVYGHQFTEVSDGDGVPLRAYVSIDFNYCTTVSSLETGDTVYGLLFILANDSADSFTQTGQQLPNFSNVPPGHAGYQIIAGDPSAHADAIAALNALCALCAYYDANSTQLIAAYNQQQANNATHQQWLQAHPPAQPDTVINFWPVKSSIYPVPH